MSSAGFSGVTVALGNEINIGPGASAGSTGAPGGSLASFGRAAAEGFSARWRLELAAMRSAGESGGGDGQAPAGATEAREAADGDRAAQRGTNPAAIRQAGGANGPAAVPDPEAEGDSAPAGSSDTPPEAGAARSAESAKSPESPESRQRPAGREAGTRPSAHSAAKAHSRHDSRAASQSDSRQEGASPQPIAVAAITGVSMVGVSAAIAPPAPARQQLHRPATAAAPGAGIPAAPAALSAAGKAAGAMQPPEGLPAGGPSLAAVGQSALSLGPEGSHGPAAGNHEAAPRGGSPIVANAAPDGDPALALSAAAGRGLQSAGAGMQADAGRDAVSASSAGAADAGRDAVSASRPARGANAGPGGGPHAEQGAGQAGAAPKTIQGHERGIAIAPAAGAADGAHGIPAQPAGAAGMAGSGPGHSAERSAEEAFAAMDAQADSPAVTWVHAGRDRAEAGFEDPALGWVAVRAEMGAGGVHAAIVPGTAEAAQALGGHMAGLSAHLAEQRVAVSALSMSSPNHPGNGPGNSPGIAPQLAGGGTEGNSGH